MIKVRIMAEPAELEKALQKMHEQFRVLFESAHYDCRDSAYKRVYLELADPVRVQSAS